MSVVVIGDLEVFLVIMARSVVGAGGLLFARVVLVTGIMLRTVAGCATFLGLVAALLYLPARLTPPTPTTPLFSPLGLTNLLLIATSLHLLASTLPRRLPRTSVGNAMRACSVVGVI